MRFESGVIAALLLASGIAAAQGIRLNRTLPRGSSPEGGDVASFRLGPDGAWAVYTADDSTDLVFDLFSVPADGSGPPRRLNAPFAPGRGLYPGPYGGFAVSALGDRVVYVADQVTDGAFDLWSAPIDGSAPAVRLNAAFAAGTEVAPDFALSSAGRVVYRADPSTDGVYELWSVPIDGSAPAVRLDAAGGNLEADSRFVLSPDGAWVVYADDPATAGVVELWRAPIDGSTPAARLAPPLPAFADLCSYSKNCFRISPDSSRVAYVADAATDGANELWSVPMDGSASPVRISGSLASGRGVSFFSISSDSSAVLFGVDKLADNKFELYWAPIASIGAAVRVSGSVIDDGDVFDARLSPDGQVALFRADAEEDDVVNLYSRPVDLGEPRLTLNDPLVAGGDVQSYELTPDGGRVVYRANQELATFQDLWSVPIDRSSAPVRLNEPAQGNLTGVGFRYVIDPSSAWVLYSLDTARGWELWSVRTDRSAGPLSLQDAVRLTGSIDYLGFEATAARAVYLADAKTDNTVELWSRPLDASASALRLNQALGADAIVGDVANFHWASGGDAVVYEADEEQDELDGLYVAQADDRPQVRTAWVPDYGGPYRSDVSPDGRWLVWAHPGDLFSVPVDGSQPPRVILPCEGEFSISPDGRRVVSSALISRRPSIYRLYSAPIEGGSGVGLSEWGPGETYIPRFSIAPDGQRVVYLKREDGAPRLCRVPIAGGPEVTLVELDSTRSIDRGFQLTPDGKEVVFVSDLEQDDVFQLYAAPIAADARRVPAQPWVRLNPALGPGGDVDPAFRISPDGRRVVYVADQDADEEFELFSVPIRGGTAVQLNAPLVGGGDVAQGVPGSYVALPLPQFELGAGGAGGARVVYRADQDADEVFELFSAPIDGSAAPVRLHRSLAPGGDVALLSTRVAPDGSTVLYAADQLADEVLELFRVPIDGSAAPVVLSGPFVAGGDLWTRTDVGARDSFALFPQGEHVVYLADQDQDEVIELYAVPLDGGQAAVRISGPLVAGGDVKSLGTLPWDSPPFEIAPDGRQVVYLADQEVDEVVELFLTSVDPATTRRAGAPTESR
jgi:Tol biopolymer transport system component